MDAPTLILGGVLGAILLAGVSGAQMVPSAR